MATQVSTQSRVAIAAGLASICALGLALFRSCEETHRSEAAAMSDAADARAECKLEVERTSRRERDICVMEHIAILQRPKAQKASD